MAFPSAAAQEESWLMLRLLYSCGRITFAAVVGVLALAATRARLVGC